MRRHLVLCILTTFWQADAVINWLFVTDTVKISDWLIIICIYYYVSVVFILSLFRLSEPIVWFSFKQTISRIFCRDELRSTNAFFKESKNDLRNGILNKDYLNDTLNVFLTSSLNVELVYTVLTGIGKLVAPKET